MALNNNDRSGCEWLIEARGCSAATLQSETSLRTLFGELIAGLHLHPAASPVEIRKAEDGKLTLVAESKTGEQVVLQGLDHVLMATGRKPNTRGLGCEEVSNAT